MTRTLVPVVAGLATGAVGIVIQILSGVDYPTVPPGLLILALAACAVALVRRWWMTLVGLVVALFILIGGAFADPGYANLTDPENAGAWVGTAVQLLGLVAAVLGGVGPMTAALGARTTRPGADS